jgi:hypothetical protein
VSEFGFWVVISESFVVCKTEAIRALGFGDDVKDWGVG